MHPFLLAMLTSISGPLATRAGDIVAKYTKVLNLLGSSEGTMSPLYDKEPEDWVYFHFDPQMKGVEFREVGDGLYEQFFLRHPSTDPFHSTWYTFPDLSEYSTKDLFSKHPTKPDLWFYEGRSDDVIVFSNGEKFNPSAMEAILRTHPDVSRCIVVGQARFEPAALIELKGSPSEEAKKELLDSFTPYIIKVNETAPAYAKLQRDHIAFTKPDKPMSMADKGTVKRAATTKAYKEEIDQLYANADDASLPTVRLDAHDRDALTTGLQDLLVGTIGLEAITPYQDIFAVGADSLQVMNLVRQLRSSFTAQQGEAVIQPHLITPKIVYSNPTAAKLADALHQLTGHSAEVSEKLEEQRIKKMEEMLAKYSEDLPKASANGVDVGECGDKLTVVLTGSTGSLGSYLLDALLASDRVSKVICLNRGAQSEDKQKKSNASRGLVTEWGKDKVQFLTTDLSKPHLGLQADDYDFLVKEASFIIRKPIIIPFPTMSKLQLMLKPPRQSVAGRFQPQPRIIRTAHRRRPRLHHPLQQIRQEAPDPLHLQYLHVGQLARQTPRREGSGKGVSRLHDSRADGIRRVEIRGGVAARSRRGEVRGPRAGLPSGPAGGSGDEEGGDVE